MTDPTTLPADADDGALVAEDGRTYRVTPEQRNGATWLSFGRLRQHGDGYYDHVGTVPEAAVSALLASRLRAVGKDTERLDWVQQHSAEVTVADDESGSCVVQSNTDYTISGSAAGYDIREAIDAARRAAPGGNQREGEET